MWGHHCKTRCKKKTSRSFLNPPNKGRQCLSLLAIVNKLTVDTIITILPIFIILPYSSYLGYNNATIAGGQCAFNLPPRKISPSVALAIEMCTPLSLATTKLLCVRYTSQFYPATTSPNPSRMHKQHPPRPRSQRRNHRNPDKCAMNSLSHIFLLVRRFTHVQGCWYPGEGM